MPLAIALSVGQEAVGTPLLIAGIVCSALPDVDSLGFWAGVPYAHMFGHRGFTHSLFFAALIGALGVMAATPLRSSPRRASTFLFVSTASHGLLDTLTDGGLGVALLSPFSNHRFFAACRPIPVSPIGIASTSTMLVLLAAELLLVWAPLFSIALPVYLWRRFRVA